MEKKAPVFMGQWPVDAALNETIRRTIIFDKEQTGLNFSATLLEMKEIQQGTPMHSHPDCEEVVYVLKGTAVLYVEGYGDIKLQAGQAVSIPRGYAHNVAEVGAEGTASLNHYIY